MIATLRFPLLLPLLLLAQALAAAPEEGVARLPPSPLSTANLINTAVGLVVVVALMLALAWVVRRFVQTPGMSRGQIRLLGGVSLGAREKAVLLAVGGRRLLVGVAPGRVQTLLVLDGEDLPGESPDDASFAEHLRAADASRETRTQPGARKSR
jgi:flagellar protein FliO/FliZ